MTDARGARILRLMDDPQIGGDLLLAGIALAAEHDFGWEHGGQIAERVWPGSHDPADKLRAVFRSDIRTYQPPTGYSLPKCVRRCTAPIPKRDTPCGRAISVWGYVTEWANGEKIYVGGCNRHYAWFDETRKANQAAKPDVVPLPPANHGGVLRVHFPRLDWVPFWRLLDPHWVEHPEVQPWPKPDLTLVLGDGDRRGLSGVPLLTVVPMGGAS